MTGNLGDTWEYDGVNWVQQTTPVSPTPRVGHGMAYDHKNARVVVATEYQGAYPDVWTWSGRPAAALTYGTGCGGASGIPALTAFGVPHFEGDALALEIVGAPGQQPAAFALSAGPANVPLPGSCNLYVAAPLVGLGSATNVGGFATLPIAMPLSPTLVGQALFVQAAVLDPTGPFAGLSWSAGLELRVGN